MKSIPIEIRRQFRQQEEFVFYLSGQEYLYVSNTQATTLYRRLNDMRERGEYWAPLKFIPCFRPILWSSFRDSLIRAFL